MTAFALFISLAFMPEREPVERDLVLVPVCMSVCTAEGCPRRPLIVCRMPRP